MSGGPDIEWDSPAEPSVGRDVAQKVGVFGAGVNEELSNILNLPSAAIAVIASKLRGIAGGRWAEYEQMKDLSERRFIFRSTESADKIRAWAKQRMAELERDPEVMKEVKAVESWDKSIRETFDVRQTFRAAGVPVGEKDMAERGVDMTSPTNKVIYNAGKGVGAAVATAPLFPAAVGAQIGFGAASGALGEVGRQEYGTTGQIAGTFAPLAPGLLAAKAPGIIQRVADAAKAGRTPSVGQALDSKTASAVEGITGSYGGVGVMARKMESDAVKVRDTLEGQAAKLSPSMEDARVGTLVKKGLTDESTGFIGRFKEKTEALFNRVSAAVPPATPVKIDQTMKVLDDSLAAIPGAEASSRLAQSENLRKFYAGLLDDVAKASGITLKPEQLTTLTTMKAGDIFAGGELPFEAVMKLRSLIGRRIGDAGLIADLPKGELKRLYGALSDDVTASLVGNPKGLKAWQSASSFYKKGLEHVDNVVEPLVAKGAPEQIMKALQGDARQGETTIRAVMSSLTPPERKVVSAWFVRSLGYSPPGAQNAVGDKFNIETFATDWAKLTDGAKRSLFDAVGKTEYRKALDAIARDAQAVKDGAAVLRNPSGTAGRAATIAGYGSVVGGAFSGQTDVMIGALGSLFAGNLTARMMTSPVTVNLLARAAKLAPSAFAQQVNAVARASNDPELKADLERFYDSIVGRQ